MYAEIAGTNFHGANLNQSRFVLAAGEAPDFSDAKIDFANFSAASLPKANFKNSSLRGARFAFANLDGADFSHADLTDALFIGATLRGANFDGATVNNTDFTAVDPLPDNVLRGACRTDGTGKQSMQVLVIEKIPNSSFSGGIEYKRLFENFFSYDTNASSKLPICKARLFAQDWTFPIWRHEDKEILSDSFSLGFDARFLEAGGRRDAILDRLDTQLFGTKEKHY
jgi:uncharacterized protein YjbI with pentapeptide repeats